MSTLAMVGYRYGSMARKPYADPYQTSLDLLAVRFLCDRTAMAHLSR
jgi:hypothetical protein